MKPQEIKLNMEFKKLQNELEDYWFTKGNDKLSDFADKTIRKKYFNIHNTIEEIKKICKGDNNNLVIKDLQDKINIYNNAITDLNKYLDDEEGFRKDFMDATVGDCKKITNKIMELEVIAYYCNLQKLANTIHCRTMQSIGRITFVINEICNEVVNPYKKTINNEIKDMSKVLKDKEKELTSINTEESTDKIEKSKVKKVFDYKKLNKLIVKNGFEETRQSGDHKIFRNDEGKSIPVPQHNLGKGISIKILKQMEG